MRIPAAWCGVLGHKPTHGLIPHSGVLGGDALLDHIGVLVRSASDGARLLQVLAGRDDRDPRQPAALPAIDFVGAVGSAATSLAGVRIGVVPEGLEPGIGVSPEVVQAFEASVAALRGAGAEVSEVHLPEHLQAGVIGFNLFTEGFATLMRGGGNGVGWEGTYWPELAAALRDGLAKRADEVSPQVKLSLILGTDRTRTRGGGFYAKAANLRPWLRAAVPTAPSSPSTSWCCPPRRSSPIRWIPPSTCRRASCGPGPGRQHRAHGPDRPPRHLAPARHQRRAARRADVRGPAVRRRPPPRPRADPRAHGRLGEPARLSAARPYLQTGFPSLSVDHVPPFASIANQHEG